MKDIIRENPIFFAQKDLLIISDARRRKIGNVYKSPYMDGMLEQVRLPYIILEAREREDRNININTENLVFYNPQVFLTCGEIQRKDKERIACLIESLEECLGINLSTEKKRVMNEMGEILASRKWFRKYYNWMLEQIKPKAIVIFGGTAVYFENLCLVEVAREKKIKTIGMTDGVTEMEAFITLCNNGKFMDKKCKELLESKYIKSSPEFLFCHLKYGQAMEVSPIIEIRTGLNAL